MKFEKSMKLKVYSYLIYDSNFLYIPYTVTNVSLILTYPFDVNFYN